MEHLPNTFKARSLHSRWWRVKVGDAQLLAVTLTPRPAQSHDKIDRVTLSEKEQQMDEQMSVDELKAALMAKDAMIAELEQKMKDMMEESDASLAGEMPEEMAEDMPEEEEEPKPEMMACGTEPEKKKLSEEPAVQAMSEATLLSEINALRVKNTQLSRAP